MTKSSVALPPVTATESASCRPQPNIDNTLKNVWTARIASSEATRTQFLELAQLWLAAAVQVDLRASGKTTWPTRDLKPGEVVRA